MITEFNLGTKTSPCWFSFYCDNFPIDLKINDKIYLDDFKGLFKKGKIYSSFKKISDEYLDPKEFQVEEVLVTDLIYGYENNKLIKILTLTEI